MKKVIILFILLLATPTSINAYYCNYNDIRHLKPIAANIQTSISYVEKDDDAYFTVKLSNLNEELYIIDTLTHKKYKYSGNELLISEFNSGKSLRFDVYPVNNNCQNELLYSIRLTLPKYNKFYKDTLCSNHEKYKLCKKWYNTSLTYNEFKKEIEKLEKQEEIKPEIKDEYKENKFLTFLANYYILGLIILIIGCGAGIYVLNKKSNIYS